MNPMHHGDLLTSGTESKLPEQAASVLQNLTNETSLSLSGGRAQTMLPTRTPRTCQALLSTRTRAGSPVHPTTPILHCRCSTLLAFSCLGTASRGSTWVSGRVAVLQPSRPAASLRTVIIRLHYCCSRISHCSGCCFSLLAPRWLARLYGCGRVPQPSSARPCLDSGPALRFEL